MAFVHSADSRSLWNCTLSPGWTRAETEVLRLCVMKYGIGSWKTISEERLLPGKSAAQMVCQMQRLLGQQSLAGFRGVRMDPLLVNARNAKKVGPQYFRKGSVLVNKGGAPSRAEQQAELEANRKEFGLSEEEAKAIVIPTLKESDTSTILVDTALRNSASAYASKLHRLNRMEQRMAALRQQLDRIEASGGSIPAPPAPKPRRKRGRAGKDGAGKRPKAAGDDDEALAWCLQEIENEG